MISKLISIFSISIIIATLIGAICNIFINGMIVIAKTIIREKVNVNFKSDLIVIMICTFIISIYFLI